MKNNFKTCINLPFLSNLFQEKTSQLPILVNNLKLKDVDEDTIFEQTIKSIKEEILLTPIVFEDPTIIDYKYHQQEPNLQQLMFGNPSKDRYVFEIKYPFSGNIKLFGKSFDGMSIDMSSSGIIEPQSTDSIIIYAELFSLKPEEAVQLANKHIKMTKYIANETSNRAITWNSSMENHIDTLLTNKRIELRNLFK